MTAGTLAGRPSCHRVHLLHRPIRASPAASAARALFGRPARSACRHRPRRGIADQTVHHLRIVHVAGPHAGGVHRPADGVDATCDFMPEYIDCPSSSRMHLRIALARLDLGGRRVPRPTSIDDSRSTRAPRCSATLSGTAAGDRSGWSVASAGDVNGDGFADVIVGAIFAARTAAIPAPATWCSARPRALPPTSLSRASTAARLQAHGAAAATQRRSVASAGDVNGDGFADLIVGASATTRASRYAGAGYVVFGKASGFAANIDLSSLDGSTGFKLSGVAADDRSGSAVARPGTSTATASPT